MDAEQISDVFLSSDITLASEEIVTIMNYRPPITDYRRPDLLDDGKDGKVGYDTVQYLKTDLRHILGEGSTFVEYMLHPSYRRAGSGGWIYQKSPTIHA